MIIMILAQAGETKAACGDAVSLGVRRDGGVRPEASVGREVQRETTGGDGRQGGEGGAVGRL